jgi:hypothetical protein
MTLLASEKSFWDFVICELLGVEAEFPFKIKKLSSIIDPAACQGDRNLPRQTVF